MGTFCLKVETLRDGLLEAERHTKELASTPPSDLNAAHFVPYLIASDELRKFWEGIGIAVVHFAQVAAILQVSGSQLPELAFEDLSFGTQSDPVRL